MSGSENRRSRLHPDDSPTSSARPAHRGRLAISLVCSFVFHTALFGVVLRFADAPATTMRDVFLVGGASVTAPDGIVTVRPGMAGPGAHPSVTGGPPPR